MSVSSSFSVTKLENLLLPSTPVPSSLKSYGHVSLVGSLKRRELVQRNGVSCDASAAAHHAEETKQFDAIKNLRAYAESIRSEEVEKCLSKMDNALSNKSREAIDDVSRGIVNKLLHGPTQYLRCEESKGRTGPDPE